MFKKLLLAITFSPTSKALLMESLRLKNLFNSELVFIHVGEDKEATRNQLLQLFSENGLRKEDYKLLFKMGDPANVILNSVKEEKADLLIAGALEKEKLLKYYIGSVARKLMREAECGVLVFKKPSLTPKSFKRICVHTDYSKESETAIKKSYELALLDNADEFVVVHDYQIPGLASSISDSGSTDVVEENKLLWQQEEEEKLRMFIHELNLKGVPVKCLCLLGKEGFESGNYAKIMNVNLYSFYNKARKFRLIDRLFPHEEEYVFEKLPSNILIIR